MACVSVLAYRVCVCVCVCVCTFLCMCLCVCCMCGVFLCVYVCLSSASPPPPPPAGITKLLSVDYLSAGTGSVLFDLGMGVGKFVLQAFVQYPNLKYIVG
ncbi:MAG: hypothetical protein P4L40_01670, partial [Terracidiphilus sp.]|nr:hypothetical protein [Terracidiphilus sp.]